MRPGKKPIKESIKAETFNHVVKRARKSYKSWLDRGEDVQVFNPGEPCSLNSTQFKGEM